VSITEVLLTSGCDNGCDTGIDCWYASCMT
jgi:hypothetical protein